MDPADCSAGCKTCQIVKPSPATRTQPTRSPGLFTFVALSLPVIYSNPKQHPAWSCGFRPLDNSRAYYWLASTLQPDNPVFFVSECILDLYAEGAPIVQSDE